MKLRPASRGQAPVDGSNLHRHARAGEHTRLVRLSMGRNDRRRSQVLEFLATATRRPVRRHRPQSLGVSRRNHDPQTFF